MNKLEWNPGEKMTKEVALEAIKGIKQFFRRLYFQPQMKPFESEAWYEISMQVMNGMEELIESSIED